ncbi:MAG TPA: hypothetical protein VFJ12_12435, partial [Segeticoccus sp.]|nr:hypothetical protein [Segeticoccus sp.]
MTKKPVAYGLAAGLAATLTLAPTAAYATTTAAAGTTASSAATARSDGSLQQRVDALLAQSNLDPALKARIHAAAAKLPADWERTVAAKQE